MQKSQHLKTVICGVALVALASVRPVMAQDETSPCPPIGEGSGVGDCITHTFDATHHTNKYDFGTHAIKITVNVLQPFDLQVGFLPITDPDLDGRVIAPLAPVDCIPYAGATSDANLGTCGFYHVFSPLPVNGTDYDGNVSLTVVWDFPTLALLHNVRLYRAPLDGIPPDNTCSQGFDCYTQDITNLVFAVGDSNTDAGVRGESNGFSDFEAVDLTSPTSAAVRIWLGLRNSDDVGTRFDLKAVVKNGASVVSSGELLGAAGGSSGFNNAKLRTIPLSLPTSAFASGNTMSVELFVRNSCVGSSHNSGTARLWFNDAAAASRVDEPGAGTLYLRQTGLPLFLDGIGDGPSTRKFRDVFVTGRNLACTGPYTSLGTWTGTVP